MQDKEKQMILDKLDAMTKDLNELKSKSSLCKCDLRRLKELEMDMKLIKHYIFN